MPVNVEVRDALFELLVYLIFFGSEFENIKYERRPNKLPIEERS